MRQPMDREKEFTIIIEENKALIYKVAGFYTDQLHDREDLFQEIVFQLWKSLGSFQYRSSLSTWIYRVAMNTSVHFLRKRRRLPLRPLSAEIRDVADTDNREQEERWRALHAGIAKLDLLERGIVMLHLEGKSYEEIGELVGLSASNVGTRLSRIREKLKKRIQHE